MPRGPFVDPEVRRFVRERVLEGERSAAALHRELQRWAATKNAELQGGSPIFVPSERTIARLIAECIPSDSSDLWHLDRSDPDDARLVLDIALAVAERTQGRVWPTVALAEWIVRVRRAAPELSVWDAYVLAVEYQIATNLHGREREEHLRALDLLLAARPWTGPEAFLRYRGLMRCGATNRLRFIWEGWVDVAQQAERSEVARGEGGDTDEAT